MEFIGKSQPILHYLYKIWSKANKGKPSKAEVMIFISKYLFGQFSSHVPFLDNGARNACWHFLASLLTKLSSLAWCQKCVVGNYKNTCKLYIYKVSATAQIIYHYSISPGSISSIVIYILSTGRSYGVVLAWRYWQICILMIKPLSCYGRGKSSDK